MPTAQLRCNQPLIASSVRHPSQVADSPGARTEISLYMHLLRGSIRLSYMGDVAQLWGRRVVFEVRRRAATAIPPMVTVVSKAKVRRMISLLARLLAGALLLRAVGALPTQMGLTASRDSVGAIQPSAAHSVEVEAEADESTSSEDDCDPRMEMPFGADSFCQPESGGVLRCVLRVTAYCDRGLTAAGIESGEGQCAAPAWIPFGTRVYVPGLDRWFVVTDRTARRFRHNTVDLFMTSYDECMEFGRHYLECEFHPPMHPHRYGSSTLWYVVSDAVLRAVPIRH